MTDQFNDVQIFTCSSSPTAPPECAGHVVVSGSYAGEYNAFHAAKWGIRGVVMSDAGVGKDNAGIKGLPYLDIIGLPAAAADANTCHIGDGDDILERGIVSHVNESAAKIGIRIGQPVREAADLMRQASVVNRTPPEISGGKRYLISENPGEPKIICVDAAPMIDASDKGAIAITGSHAALFRGRPDNMVSQPLAGLVFSDAGGGKDKAGVTRLRDLDTRNIPAGAASVASAAIGNSRDILANGILSYVNDSASQVGAVAGMSVKDFVERLLTLSHT
jgi:uncharacterized protein YunC (DUF1805 family)